MLPGTAHRVSAICHDLRFIVRKEFPGKETTRRTGRALCINSRGTRAKVSSRNFQNSSGGNDDRISFRKIQMCFLNNTLTFYNTVIISLYISATIYFSYISNAAIHFLSHRLYAILQKHARMLFIILVTCGRQKGAELLRKKKNFFFKILGRT